MRHRPLYDVLVCILDFPACFNTLRCPEIHGYVLLLLYHLAPVFLKHFHGNFVNVASLGNALGASLLLATCKERDFPFVRFQQKEDSTQQDAPFLLWSTLSFLHTTHGTSWPPGLPKRVDKYFLFISGSNRPRSCPPKCAIKSTRKCLQAGIQMSGSAWKILFTLGILPYAHLGGAVWEAQSTVSYDSFCVGVLWCLSKLISPAVTVCQEQRLLLSTSLRPVRCSLWYPKKAYRAILECQSLVMYLAVSCSAFSTWMSMQWRGSDCVTLIWGRTVTRFDSFCKQTVRGNIFWDKCQKKNIFFVLNVSTGEVLELENKSAQTGRLFGGSEEGWKTVVLNSVPAVLRSNRQRVAADYNREHYREYHGLASSRIWLKAIQVLLLTTCAGCL